MNQVKKLDADGFILIQLYLSIEVKRRYTYKVAFCIQAAVIIVT